MKTILNVAIITLILCVTMMSGCLEDRITERGQMTSIDHVALAIPPAHPPQNPANYQQSH